MGKFTTGIAIGAGIGWLVTSGRAKRMLSSMKQQSQRTGIGPGMQAPTGTSGRTGGQMASSGGSMSAGPMGTSMGAGSTGADAGATGSRPGPMASTAASGMTTAGAMGAHGTDIGTSSEFGPAPDAFGAAVTETHDLEAQGRGDGMNMRAPAEGGLDEVNMPGAERA